MATSGVPKSSGLRMHGTSSRLKCNSGAQHERSRRRVLDRRSGRSGWGLLPDNPLLRRDQADLARAPPRCRAPAFRACGRQSPSIHRRCCDRGFSLEQIWDLPACRSARLGTVSRSAKSRMGTGNGAAKAGEQISASSRPDCPGSGQCASLVPCIGYVALGKLALLFASSVWVTTHVALISGGRSKTTVTAQAAKGYESNFCRLLS